MNKTEQIIHDALELSNVPTEDGKAVSVSAMIQELAETYVITVAEATAAIDLLAIWANSMSAANMERYIAAHYLTYVIAEDNKKQSKKPILTLVPNTNNQLADKDTIH